MGETPIDPGSAERESGMEDFEFGQQLVKRAGELVRQMLAEGHTTEWKPDNTPVTSIDIAVNRLIIEEIKKQYPDDRVYGEEESSEYESATGNTWVVDPIDGTQNLEQGGNAFTVLLARLDEQGLPLWGIGLNPTTNELFAAKRGEVATLNGQPIHVSAKQDLKGSAVYLGSRIQGEALPTNGKVYDAIEANGGKVFNPRALGFGCMQVARGVAEAAVIGAKTPFEAATVQLIVEGAGGRVTDLYGSEPGRMDGDIKGMLVSNGIVHEQLLEALQP